MSEYEKQANDFLAKNGLNFRATPYPEEAQDAPRWSNNAKPSNTPFGPMTHGTRYRITIWRNDEPGKLAFDFWGSIRDRVQTLAAGRSWHNMPPGVQKYLNSTATRFAPAHPTAYDVLACISSDIDVADTFEEFCADLGYDTDSRTAFATFQECAELSRKLLRFFSEAERVELAEIS